MNIAELVSKLKAEQLDTWFDLGLFLDRLKVQSAVPSTRFDGDLEEFRRTISAGVGFVTFDYGIDGVTMEIVRYAKTLQRILGGIPIHFISGKFSPETDGLLDPSWERSVLSGLDGFDSWPLYESFFHRRLDRGGPLYNELIGLFWADVLSITEKLGRYIEDHQIRLLFLANTNSNPGNVALALANVLLSESLGIPVISNNHDFFWEGGMSQAERCAESAQPGPRDHFFANAHLGEVFSIIQMLYPWESRSWISVNINDAQSRQLVSKFGHNPANVTQISTAVEAEADGVHDPRRRTRAMKQVAQILGQQGDRVRSEAVNEVWRSGALSQARRRPILIGRVAGAVDFVQHTLVLLQPTRIIARKRMELNFELIRRLLEQPDFRSYFDANRELKLVLVVTGPVARGADKYLATLLREFVNMIEELSRDVHDRVYLAFLFRAFDDAAFRAQVENPIDMRELYHLASMVVLPSEVEGRGLPILESAAYGIPIFVRRYHPVDVYKELIGEDLPESQRLRVLETSGSPIEPALIERIALRLIDARGTHVDLDHNRRVVRERYGQDRLQHNFENILEHLHLQLQGEVRSRDLAIAALKEFQSQIKRHPEAVSKVLDTTKRQYLPGYGQMAFMIYLKSLIDPSFFRVEQQRVRGLAMEFASWLAESHTGREPMTVETRHVFFNAVDELFRHRDGPLAIQHDHSFSYRLRGRDHYPYQDLTPQELTGVINLLLHSLVAPSDPVQTVRSPAKAFTDWAGMVARLCGTAEPVIDHRDQLRRKLSANLPVIYFTGRAILQELELLVLAPIRWRLELPLDEEITQEHLDGLSVAPVYLFKRQKALGSHLTASTLRSLVSSATREVKLLFSQDVCRIVETDQISQGIDFRQLGQPALEIMDGVRQKGGFLLAMNRHAAMMTDIVDLDRFHIGQVTSPLEAQIMGISAGSGYVQWVPASVRSTLTYPVPVQTAADLSRALKGDRYRRLCSQLGEEEVLGELRRDAQANGSPVESVLRRLASSQEEQSGPVSHTYMNGRYDDGLPWSGVLATVATVDCGEQEMAFRLERSESRPASVLELIDQFEKVSPGKRVQIAWNGGYSLNPELVGKLGCPESYIGSPLGLIIADGQIGSVPLFNKPAFLIAENGRIEIRRVSCAGGLSLRCAGEEVVFGADQYNRQDPGSAPAFYDLMYSEPEVTGNGRLCYQLAGNRIITIRSTEIGQNFRPLPVGLTLSFPPDQYPKDWQEGQELDIEMTGWPPFLQAIEAGPLLVSDGHIAIDMEAEGWNTENSIRTQAARLDYTDMRGPKIAVGLDSSGGLMLLCINGRIRESVGATHEDMARILLSRGAITAMGFDPGGSSTLVVRGQVLNVPPYNSRYEQNIYALRPEPRFVANTMIGYQ